jgi:hypothetical protein
VEIEAVKYCLQTFGSPLSTEAPPKGEDDAYWSNARMYKEYANKETLQNVMAALQNVMAGLQSEKAAFQSEKAALQVEKAEILKKENLLLQQRQQGTASVAQSGSEVSPIKKQGKHRGSYRTRFESRSLLF